MAEQATQTPPVNNGQQVQLSAEMLAMIHGHVNEEEKHNKLDKSLHRHVMPVHAMPHVACSSHQPELTYATHLMQPST